MLLLLLLLLLFTQRCVCAGLVEGGGERPPGLRAGRLRQEAGPKPVGQPQQPDGRVHHLRATEPDRDTVSRLAFLLFPVP